jgi:hypothetical protein
LFHQPAAAKLQLHRFAKTFGAVGGTAAEITLEFRLLDQSFVVLLIVYMVAIGYEITQMFCVFIAFAYWVIFWVFFSHNFLFQFLTDGDCLAAVILIPIWM